MKSLFIATVLASSAFAASAMSGNGEIYGFDHEASGPSKTRAEVVAELREAQATGSIAYGNIDGKRSVTHQAASTSTLTPAEVRMEAAELALGGKLYSNSQSHGSMYRN